MCWANIDPLPPTQSLPLVRSCRTNVRPTTVHELLKLECWTNVGPMSARQQWHLANNSFSYPKNPTITQPWPKGCLLSGVSTNYFYYFIYNFIIKRITEKENKQNTQAILISNSFRITVTHCHKAIKQLGFFNVLHRLWHGTYGQIGPDLEPWSPFPYPYPRESGGAWVAHFLGWAPGAPIGA